MSRLALDEIDIKILNALSRNCRASYHSLGSEIGLTPKSIKARVKKLESDGVINNFVIKMNPMALDYTMSCFLIVRYDKTNDTDIIRSINMVGDIIGRLDCIGNVSALLIAIKDRAEEEKLGRLIDALRSNLVQYHIVMFPSIREQLTNTDLKILRCLFSNPRMEVSDIAEQISMTPKTVTRRLEKMMKNRVLEFSVLCNLKIMPGYIISIVSAKVEKTSYGKVLEKTYADLRDSFLLRSPFLCQDDDTIIWIVCSRDVIALDSFMRTLESYAGVKRVDVFITTRLEYYKEVIIGEIEKRIKEGTTSNAHVNEAPKIVA